MVKWSMKVKELAKDEGEVGPKERAFIFLLRFLTICVLTHLLLTCTLGEALTDKSEAHVAIGVVKKAIWSGGKSSKGTVFLEESGDFPSYLTTYNRKLIGYLNSNIGTKYQFEYYIDYTYSIFEPQMIILQVRACRRYNCL